MAPSLANPTLQGLLSSPLPVSMTTIPDGQLLTTTAEGIQIIALGGSNDLLPVQSDGRVWQLVHPDMAAVITVADPTQTDDKQIDVLSAGTVIKLFPIVGSYRFRQELIPF